MENNNDFLTNKVYDTEQEAKNRRLAYDAFSKIDELCFHIEAFYQLKMENSYARKSYKTNVAIIQKRVTKAKELLREAAIADLDFSL